MTMAELATIVQEKLNVKIAIINNGYLGMVRQWQEFFYEGRYAGTPLLSPDYVKLAEAYGIPGLMVSERSQVVPALHTSRFHNGAALIDFRVEQEDSVYPMVPARADFAAQDRPPTPFWAKAAAQCSPKHPPA